ncbi:alpha/beta fold hydrolase [Thermoactinospora rubra]|uniref:alpha/beta fold hydrolase n=1 Tax=Thermoactinospora rubra TaxID=1088767 RepID=UPI000A0FE978|nr:alpha/beta hydrolase [Thermoactinospora rubra]
MFEDFAEDKVKGLYVRHGGDGPAVLLLHGHPRTHATWHRVAPLLAEDFTVICPDLTGYGRSEKPQSTPDHEPYSKRAMARDCVGMMRALGHDRFAVAGHDRGCYVAQRMALDHPSAVTKLVVMDGIPIGEALARADARFAAAWWHWFFLGQTGKPAEEIINRDPDAWYGGTPERMGEEGYEDYRRAIHDPAVVHAMCEDYRAGLGLDREADDADRRAGRRIGCPTLFLWSAGDDMEELYGDPLAIWADWADDVRGRRIDSGHHMAEEAPQELAAALRDFLGG